ncbi:MULTISPECIES: response regulator [Roseateles]|uniref:Response regulator n=1 Tax=Pelomonas caseinilytica TaxID=2906763 RepID=A0ABS8XP01_9BURK|nr:MULTISPECIES: response regulator [unclassified Roseateles]MCE4538935.1 response regulator [Pelomonas sp. P7]HEV6968783.1 response regulator [Roseateles sp.]
MAKTILIVDDSASVRQVVSISLRQAGYDVIDAVDGEDALAKLDGRKLHLVISDVNMPRLDGIGLLTKMKAIPAYRFTPVIMLTTEAGDAKKQQGREAGAKAWVVKPFQPAQLLAAVAKLILP